MHAVQNDANLNNHYWGPEDYENFIKAFLRSDKLTDAFLKPEFGGHQDRYMQPIPPI